MSSSTEHLTGSEYDDHGVGISGESRRIRGLVLEPAVLLLFFAIDLSGAIIQNQIIYQTCTQVYGYNNSDCLLLGTENAKHRTARIETEIQPYVANIFMVRSVIDGVIPTFGALFVGAWSDRFGRKPLILAGFIGHCSLHILCAILAYISTLYSINPWFYIVMMLPKAILSADCSLKSGAFAYITDITDNNNRMLRMAVYEAFLYVGIIAGFLSSSAVFHATNAYTVFAISGGIVLLALLLLQFGLEESLNRSEIDETSSVNGLFRWSLVRDLINTGVKNRSRNDRAILWLIISTVTLNIFVVGGAANVSFLFVREKFKWTVVEFTQYEAIQIAIQIVGNTCVIFLLRKIFKVSIATIALLAYASCTIDVVIKGTAHVAWELYIAAGSGILKGTPGPMCRSIMATFIPANEIGKVFSFISALQSLTPLLSAPFYTELYSRTLRIDAGVFNIVSAGFYTICFIFMAIVFGIIKCYKYRGSRELSVA